MRILVISLNAWNLSNSTGNTLANLFSRLDDNDEVANIYCRNELIDNNICKRYFKVTEWDILKNLFTPHKCGRIVYLDKCEKTHHGDKSILNGDGVFFKKHRYTIFLLLREVIWSIPVWRNKKLKGFVEGFGPDIIYMHGHYNLYMHWLLSFCQKITGAKVVMYWGDDMYGRKATSPLSFLYENLLRNRFKKSIELSSLLFGGSLRLCDEYSRIFGKEFVPYFKECKKIRVNEKRELGNPLTIVYAGNLLFGREEVMVSLVKAIAQINNESKHYKFFLKVISNSIPTKESLSYLNDTNNSCFLGYKSYSEVCEEMDKSDMVLFIESFQKKSILSTRLSFSTKIIDCMQSTAAILAIGPKEIASIDYLEYYHLGYIITDLNELITKLSYLMEHPEVLFDLNVRKAEFAIKNHTNTSARAISAIRKIV